MLPLCLIGDSGTGKNHLLIALGTEAAMTGFRVRSTLAAKPRLDIMRHNRLRHIERTKSADAVHLYESIGFVHVPSEQIGPMPYERAMCSCGTSWTDSCAGQVRCRCPSEAGLNLNPWRLCRDRRGCTHH